MTHDPAIGNEDKSNGFVDDYLLYLLAAASDAASGEFHAQVRSTGLRVPEWRVLACLHDNDGAMITQLAKLALIEQSRLTRIIIQMEERGQLIRKDDPEDRRRVRVYVTAKGRALVAGLVTQARAHEQELLSQLDSNSRAHLKPILQTLLSVLQNDTQGAQ